MKAEYIYEQGSGTVNEDNFVISSDMAAVFDGATSLDKKKDEHGKTGGGYASGIARQVFLNNNDSLVNLADKANSAILKKMTEKGVDIRDRTHLWSTSAAVVRIKNNTAEWVQTGDSLVMLIYEDGSYRIPVKTYNHDRDTLIMWKKTAETTDRSVFDVLNHQIKKVRCNMNRTYGVLNGETAYSDFLCTGSESIKGLSHILVFTDGLFIPCKDPDNREDFDLFVKLFRLNGLSGIREHVRSLELSDPECRMYPRFKPHDDIAAVSIAL